MVEHQRPAGAPLPVLRVPLPPACPRTCWLRCCRWCCCRRRRVTCASRLPLLSPARPAFQPADALSVLELAVLFTLYPVHHDLRALAAWHHALASNETAFATCAGAGGDARMGGCPWGAVAFVEHVLRGLQSAVSRPQTLQPRFCVDSRLPPWPAPLPPCSRRLSLARSLALMARAQAAVGSATASVDAMEAAVIAGRAAAELVAMAGGLGGLSPGVQAAGRLKCRSHGCVACRSSYGCGALWEACWAKHAPPPPVQTPPRATAPPAPAPASRRRTLHRPRRCSACWPTPLAPRPARCAARGCRNSSACWRGAVSSAAARAASAPACSSCWSRRCASRCTWWR